VTRIDEPWPPRGPYGICGDEDARHRIWYAISTRRIAGEAIDDLARDYGVTEEAIDLAIEWSL